MKIYISADIEGVVGISDWDETRKSHPDYPPFRDQMLREVSAACEGAIAAGATDIYVQDAHGTARNLPPEELPAGVQLIRGWAGHPLDMVQALDETFDALLFVGYHAAATRGANPLAHTIHCGKLTHVKVNGTIASEFLLNALSASSLGVPVAFLSGDAGICEEVQQLNPAIATVAVKRGMGAATISLHPLDAEARIRDTVRDALRGELSAVLVPLPDHFEIEVRFVNHRQAYRAGFYPGVTRIDDHTIAFAADVWFEVMRMLLFVV